MRLGDLAHDVLWAGLASFTVTSVQLIALGQTVVPSFEVPKDTGMLTWAFQVGGPIFVTLLIVLAFYRNDFRKTIAQAKTDNAMLVQLVQSTVTAMQANTSETSRMARAIETQRPCGYQGGR